MNKLLNGIDSLSYWSGKLASYLIIPLTLVICYTVIMRTFFSQSPDWGFEISIFLYGIGILIGGAEVLRVNEHVSVDVFPRLVSERMRNILAIVSTLIIIVVCLIMMVQGYNSAMTSTLISERSSHQSSFNPPIWWYKWIIPLAASLVFLQAIKRLVEEIKTAAGKGGKNDY